MLHTDTVDDSTLELIRQLQSDPVMQDFILVGGTALSLQIGHRISVDIHFFTQNEFNNQEMLEHLEQNYGFQEQYRSMNTLKGIINGVFVDLLRHDYKYIAGHLLVEGIKMASKQDIAAMKVNAITGNGSRVKDFIDIYFLLKEFSFSQIIEFYKTKYDTRNDFHAIKSLTYFEDIVAEEWPNMILEKGLSLKDIKRRITEQRDIYLNHS
ncbi:MAG: nucleotidyl transferase AbiEii/AbiGii toxin family protein [Bacteroidales bacterium]|nr:nucleotidyl transferase AbiEii/AbiGii toxin family protein [Bacteroidales bacterium]